MLDVLVKAPLYRSFRRYGFPKMLPLNLTISVTYRCNARCRTCNVWRKKAQELTAAEWERVFLSLRRSPYWLTFSGGEPLLRADIVDIVSSAYTHCRPAIINIPTNGLRPDLIVPRIEALVESCPRSQIIVNLSLDGLGRQHDDLRNVPGNFQQAQETWRGLQALERRHLTLGIHTVISRYNVAHLPRIYRGLAQWEPDSYITEIAEERVELDTTGLSLAPSLADYSRAVDFLVERVQNHSFAGISRVTQAFRLQYYALVKRILAERRQVIPCYAGFISAQIAPDGEVWFCCTRAEGVGHLREVDYNFRTVWLSAQAEAARRTIRQGDCFCPLANAAYTNMLCHYPTLAKVGWQVLSGWRRSAKEGHK